MVGREGRWPPRLRDLRATLRKLITIMHGLEPLGSRRGEGHGNAPSEIICGPGGLLQPESGGRIDLLRGYHGGHTA